MHQAIVHNECWSMVGIWQLSSKSTLIYTRVFERVGSPSLTPSCITIPMFPPSPFSTSLSTRQQVITGPQKRLLIKGVASTQRQAMLKCVNDQLSFSCEERYCTVKSWHKAHGLPAGNGSCIGTWRINIRNLVPVSPSMLSPQVRM